MLENRYVVFLFVFIKLYIATTILSIMFLWTASKLGLSLEIDNLKYSEVLSGNALFDAKWRYLAFEAAPYCSLVYALLIANLARFFSKWTLIIILLAAFSAIYYTFFSSTLTMFFFLIGYGPGVYAPMVVFLITTLLTNLKSFINAKFLKKIAVLILVYFLGYFLITKSVFMLIKTNS